MTLEEKINEVLSDRPSEWLQMAQYRKDHADELAIKNSKKLTELVENRKKQNKR